MSNCQNFRSGNYIRMGHARSKPCKAMGDPEKRHPQNNSTDIERESNVSLIESGAPWPKMTPPTEPLPSACVARPPLSLVGRA